jgi:hypothetical protein
MQPREQRACRVQNRQFFAGGVHTATQFLTLVYAMCAARNSLMVKLMSPLRCPGAS